MHRIDWQYIDRSPALAPLFARAALRRRASGNTLPNLGLRCWVTVDPAKAEAFREVCGIASSALLPPTYPHVLAFPLQMKLLTDPRFPLPLLGMVHLGNRITVHRPLGGVIKALVSVRTERLEPHEKGVTFHLITQVEDALGVLWEEDSQMLCRGVQGSGASPEHYQPAPLPMTRIGQWLAPADIGRRYARVSGDVNPIHLSAASARLFGFPCAIAHGLWLKSRALAALDEHLPEPPLEVDVQFGKPVRLPSEVSLSASAAAPDGQFQVEGAPGIVHLNGSWSSSSGTT